MKPAARQNAVRLKNGDTTECVIGFGDSVAGQAAVEPVRVSERVKQNEIRRSPSKSSVCWSEMLCQRAQFDRTAEKTKCLSVCTQLIQAGARLDIHTLQGSGSKLFILHNLTFFLTSSQNFPFPGKLGIKCDSNIAHL